MPEVQGYEPISLAGVYNAPMSLLDGADASMCGPKQRYGLPFEYGSDLNHDSLLRVASGDGAVAITVAQRCTWLLFLHAIEEPVLDRGGAAGDVVGEYRFAYDDGEQIAVPLRQRFEIGPTPRAWPGRAIHLDWGQSPFLALPDAEPTLNPRVYGRFDHAGGRFMDVCDPQAYPPFRMPYRFFLWPWANPRPDRAVATVSVIPSGPTLLLAALTMSRLDEEPISRAVSVPVTFTLASNAVDENTAVSVDRGSATYVYRTARDSQSSTPRGWGGSAQPNEGYVRVAASPSATVSLTQAGAPQASLQWGELLTNGEVSTPDGTVWRVREVGRTWLRASIVDETSGERLPCRVHIHTAAGVPIVPYGHHAHIASDGNTWNLDIGGDVRLGERTYAYVDGEFEAWVPYGRVIIEISHGFEYEPATFDVDISPGQTALTLSLARKYDPVADGYVSADTHVHFVSTFGAELEARCEGVRVVNLLLSQWGHLYSNVEDFTGHPHYSHDGRTVVHAGQENRTAMLGHISLLGLRRPIRPWCTGGPEESELGGGLETTLAHWADECHEQGGVVVIAHFPVPNGETAALIATDRIDGVELIAYDDYNIREYYSYLNAGYRLTLVGGTDKMSSEVPIGLLRTYAKVDDPHATDYWDWCNGVRTGNTLVTSGPYLTLQVDQQPPGSVVRDARGRTLKGEARLQSIFAVGRAEIVVNGEVVESRTWNEPIYDTTIDFDLMLDDDSWVIARCYGGRDGLSRHFDIWKRPIAAHTSPIYIALDADYARNDAQVLHKMSQLVDGVQEHIEYRARTRWPGPVDHRHGEADHLGFLVRPLREARRAIRDRLDEQPPT